MKSLERGGNSMGILWRLELGDWRSLPTFLLGGGEERQSCPLRSALRRDKSGRPSALGRDGPPEGGHYRRSRSG
jgi:hypothetical protein